MCSPIPPNFVCVVCLVPYIDYNDKLSEVHVSIYLYNNFMLAIFESYYNTHEAEA